MRDAGAEVNPTISIKIYFGAEFNSRNDIRLFTYFGRSRSFSACYEKEDGPVQCNVRMDANIIIMHHSWRYYQVLCTVPQKTS